MTDATFEAAFATLLPIEGGFQKRADDPGNWTGGKVGVGEWRGTNIGISAAQYPVLDIEHLTQTQAHDIYQNDFWLRFGLWRLPPSIGIKIFVCGVDIGMASAFTCLQRALRACGTPIAEDGKLGPETLDETAKAPFSSLLSALKSEIAAHYRLVAVKEEAAALPGWLNRAYG